MRTSIRGTYRKISHAVQRFGILSCAYKMYRVGPYGPTRVFPGRRAVGRKPFVGRVVIFFSPIGYAEKDTRANHDTILLIKSRSTPKISERVPADIRVRRSILTHRIRSRDSTNEKSITSDAIPAFRTFRRNVTQHVTVSHAC